MTYTRPHEDRLADGTPSVGDVVSWTGTGTATYITPSGLTVPDVIYAECNSPAGTGDDDPLPWDNYFDKDQASISGGTLTAALAAIGLTVTADVFAATGPGLYQTELSYIPVTAPAGQTNQIRLTTDSFLSDPRALWSPATENPPGNVDRTIGFTFYLATGEEFSVFTVAGGVVTAGVITYAAMSIMKLA